MKEYKTKRDIDRKNTDFEMVISLTHEQPIRFRPRRLSYAEKGKL